MNYVSLRTLNALRFSADPVSIHTLRAWCRSGTLPARQFGREWRVDLDSLDGDTVVAKRKNQAAAIVGSIFKGEEAGR